MIKFIKIIMSEIFNRIMVFFNNKELLTILKVVTHWVNFRGHLKTFFSADYNNIKYHYHRTGYNCPFFFFKDLTATVDSVLSKQTWAILRIIEPADSEVPDLTQWWGALSVYFVYLCHLRLVQSRTQRRPSSALSTPLCPLRVTKKRLNTSCGDPGGLSYAGAVQ